MIHQNSSSILPQSPPIDKSKELATVVTWRTARGITSMPIIGDIRGAMKAMLLSLPIDAVDVRFEVQNG